MNPFLHVKVYPHSFYIRNRCMELLYQGYAELGNKAYTCMFPDISINLRPSMVLLAEDRMLAPSRMRQSYSSTRPSLSNGSHFSMDQGRLVSLGESLEILFLGDSDITF